MFSRIAISRLFSVLLLVAMTLPVPVGAQAAPVANPPAPDAPTALAAAWYDGLIQYSTITNCVSIIQGTPYQEYGAGTYVGFLADPNAGQPAPNTTYYVHVVIAGLGNSCSGMRAYLDIALPASTSLAIDASNPVYCLYDGVQISPASDCPQSLPSSTYNLGAYAIWSTDGANDNTWPIPRGHTLEFQIPVKSSTALSNSPLQANVWMLDGNSSPWLRPQQGVYVFGSQPTIIYPSPSTTSVTTTSAHSQAYLYAFNTTGTGYFDLGTTTSYELIHEAVSISTPAMSWLVWDDWGPPSLQSDTLYHWRFTYTTGSQTYYGADQTFRTLPVILTRKSTGTQDGWILESGENTAIGGTFNANATIFNIGDNAAKKQYRGILSFNTGAGLPDNAVITKVTLKIKKQGITGGGNPVTAFQGFMVDIKKGFFGTAALQVSDFQTAANKTYGPFKTALISGWYSINLTSGKAYINKLASSGGLTQIRLRFKLDDNNNAVANYLSLYSGNASTAATRPQLIIQYYVP